MRVVDASTMVDALTARSGATRRAVRAIKGRLQVPAVFPAEVTSGIRRLVLSGEIDHELAALARHDLASMRIRLHPFWPYAERVWELRHNLSVYDAWYVALAERLDQPLITIDAAILKAPGLRCQIIDARIERQSL